MEVAQAAPLKVAPLLSAVESGDVRTLEALLEQDASAINDSDADGVTPMHLAVRRSDVACMQLLLRHGASVQAKDKSGRRPAGENTSLAEAQNSYVDLCVNYMLVDSLKLDLLQHLRRLQRFADMEETHKRVVELMAANDVQRALRTLMSDAPYAAQSAIGLNTGGIAASNSQTSLASMSSSSLSLSGGGDVATSFATFLAGRPLPTVASTHPSAAAANPAPAALSGMAAAMAGSSLGFLAMPRVMPSVTELRPSEVVPLVVALFDKLLSTGNDASVLSRGGFLQTVAAMVSLDDISQFRKVIALIHKVLQLDTEGDALARAARVWTKPLVHHGLRWDVLEANTDDLHMVVSILEKFSAFHSTHKEMLQGNVAVRLLHYSNDNQFPVAVAELAMSAVANLAETTESHAEINTFPNLQAHLSNAIGSASRTVTREALRLAAMLDIDTRVLGYPDRNLLLCELPENYIMFPAARHRPSDGIKHAHGVQEARERNSSEADSALGHTPSSSKGSIQYNGVNASAEMIPSVEDHSSRSDSKGSADDNRLSMSDVRAVNLVGMLHLLLQPDPMDKAFATNIVSALPSICSPIVFFRLLAHCFRHKELVDTKLQSLLSRSPSATSLEAVSEEDATQAWDKLTDEVDDIVEMYGAEAAAAGSQSPPTQSHSLLGRIASVKRIGAPKRLGGGRRESTESLPHDENALNTTQAQVIELLKLWMELAPEDFNERKLRRSINLLLAESLVHRPNNPQLLALHSTLLGIASTQASQTPDNHRKFCNHNEIYVKARDAVVSGQLPCEDDDLLFLAALSIHVETPVGVAYRLNIGAKLEGEHLIEAIKHFVFTTPLVPRSHVMAAGNIKGRRRNSFSSYIFVEEDDSHLRGIVNGGITATQVRRERYRKRLAVRIAEIYNKSVIHMTEKEAKHTYIGKCRSLRTYGYLFFSAKLMTPAFSNYRPMLLGVNDRKLIVVDPSSNVIRETFVLSSMKQCAARDGLLLLRAMVTSPAPGSKVQTDVVCRVFATDSATYLSRLILRMTERQTDIKASGAKASEPTKGFMLDLRMNRGCPPDPLSGDPVSSVVTSTAHSEKSVHSLGEGLGAIIQIGIGVSLPRVLSTADALMMTAEFARQLTLVEQGIYNNITRRAVLAYVNRSKDKENPIANSVKAVIAHFNHISDWVSSEVVKEENDARRLILVRRFIQLGKMLLDIHNFNGVMEIISGLNSSSVRKLQMTWKALSKEEFAVFKQLEQVMASTGSFVEYRRALCSTPLPCLPYFGVYLTDLTFVEDGNADNIGPRGLVNLAKRKKVNDILDDVMRFQREDYCYVSLPPFAECIKNVQPLGEDERYALALQLVERVQ